MVTLADIMTRRIVTVNMDETLGSVRAIFDRYRFHHVLVVREDKLVGVLSDRDLLKHISPFVGNDLMERSQDANTLQRRVHQVMIRNPIVGKPELTIPEAAKLVLDRNVSCLPVVDEAMRPRGIVTWRDLLMHCRFNDSTECGRDDDCAFPGAEAA
jgi:acetoin utilization protein AcuB